MRSAQEVFLRSIRKAFLTRGQQGRLSRNSSLAWLACYSCLLLQDTPHVEDNMQMRRPQELAPGLVLPEVRARHVPSRVVLRCGSGACGGVLLLRSSVCACTLWLYSSHSTAQVRLLGSRTWPMILSGLGKFMGIGGVPLGRHSYTNSPRPRKIRPK